MDSIRNLPPINREKKVANFLEEMLEQYNPSPKFHQRMEVILEKLYNPAFPEDKINHILTEATFSYIGQCDVSKKASKTRENLQQFDNKLEAYVLSCNVIK